MSYYQQNSEPDEFANPHDPAGTSRLTAAFFPLSPIIGFDPKKP
jgi:hypothetical protein